MIQPNTDHCVRTPGLAIQIGRNDEVLTLTRQPQLSGPPMLLIKAIVKPAPHLFCSIYDQPPEHYSKQPEPSSSAQIGQETTACPQHYGCEDVCIYS
jgi:hypothetical protein